MTLEQSLKGFASLIIRLLYFFMCLRTC